jgi:hypothetical protein
MKITTQQELSSLIATADEFDTIVLNEDLEITFDCTIPCNIYTKNIKTYNIEAWNIYAKNIKAYNIRASNIDAWNINAWNINYYASCIAYRSLKCKSILGNRKNSFHKCLDQEIEIKKEKVTIELTQDQLDKIKHLI